MAEDPMPLNFEVRAEGEELEPLVPADVSCESETLDLEFDESGLLARAGGAAIEEPVLAPSRPSPRPPIIRPCSLQALNGSWLLELTPTGPAFPLLAIRGPMRLEA